MEDICLALEKEQPQWKPSSASPAVSTLISIGCAREERKFNVRRIFHVHPYTQEDRKKITQQGKRSKAAEQAAAGSAKILLAFGTNRTETMTIVEARQLYEQLHLLFGSK